jgi:hypothetical protein
MVHRTVWALRNGIKGTPIPSMHATLASLQLLHSGCLTDQRLTLHNARSMVYLSSRAFYVFATAFHIVVLYTLGGYAGSNLDSHYKH